MTWSHLIFFSAILNTAFASSFVSIADSPRPANLQNETRLHVSLLNGQIHQPEVYANAIAILDKMDKSPSCQRLATLTLIESCQSLEVSPSSEVELFEIRSEYGIRLALCEMEGAAKIPSECTDFLPSDCSIRKSFGGFFRGSKKTRETSNSKVCYTEVTTRQIEQCRSALYGTAQDWTSYSNKMQSIDVVCQASRNAIEQGKVFRGRADCLPL